MQKDIHILVTEAENKNVGVLYLGALDRVTLKEERLKQIVLKHLQEALEDHFDAEVKVVSLDIKTNLPMTMEAEVEIDSDEQAVYNETIFLDETWMY
jgi:hypothetical protein